MADERQRAEEYAEELGIILGDSLVSVVLYGSVARAEHRTGRSDINLLVIARELGIDQLRATAKSARQWAEAGNPPPMMLSAEEWRNSSDVFALEYSDIRDAHVILAGSDPFAETRIRREHLRLQVEREFRSKKIQLREGYLATGDAPDELGELLIRSLSTFLLLFRALLRLAGRPVPRDPRQLVAETSQIVGFSPDSFLEILDARSGDGALSVGIQSPLPAAYLTVIDRCVSWLDAYTPGNLPEEV